MEFVVESSLNTHELLKTCPDPCNNGLLHFIYFGSLKLLTIELFLLCVKKLKDTVKCVHCYVV